MAEQEKRAPAEGWLDAATKAIRFGPDRKAVRAELTAHLEDKALDFQRIFPGLTEDEAKERAAAEMGDPEEIGRELALLHRPLLGYAWLASKVLLGVVIGAAVLFNGTYRAGLFNLMVGPSSRYGEEGLAGSDYYRGREVDYQGNLADSGPIQVGEYTFTTHQGELWTVAGQDGERSRVLYIQLEVHHPRPLEPLSFLVTEEIWAQDDRGGVILSSEDYYALDDLERRSYEVVYFDPLDYGVFTDRYEVSLEITDRSAQRVDLRYTAMGADLTVPISLEVTEP